MREFNENLFADTRIERMLDDCNKEVMQTTLDSRIYKQYHYHMNIKLHTIPVNVSSFKIINGFNEAEKEDKEYYKSLTPQQRLSLAEYLRSLTYEDDTQRLQRIFEVIKR